MPKPLTPSNPMTALVNLNLDAVALCNEGANSRAHIVLTKRRENKSMPKTIEELLKALNPDQADIITKHIDFVLGEKDEVIKTLNEQVSTLTGEVDTLKKAKPAAPVQEDVLKNASPEVIEMVTKLQGTVNDLVAERQEDLAKARYEKVKAIPVEEATLKSVLKSASPAVIEVLEKAATALEVALVAKGIEAPNTFASSSADDSYNKLEKSARALMAEDGKMTFEKAFTIACENDAVTYKNYVKGAK